MKDILKVLQQEKKKAERRVFALGKALQAVAETFAAANSTGRGGRRRLSPAARAKISRAQKARWAKQKATKK